MASRIILGIDGSLQSTGLALIDGDTGEVLNYDRIPIKPNDFNGDELLKIHHIANTIVEICKEYKVTHIAIENSYVSVNGRTGITLSRLCGGITTLLIENNFTLIYIYVPSTWRKIVTGVGNKSKEGCYKWVKDNLCPDFPPFATKGKNKNDDMVDAIGVAYCLYKKLNNIK